MQNSLLSKTSASYSNNIITSGVKCGLGRDITSIDGSKVFLTAGTKITEKIKDKIGNLQMRGMIATENDEDNIQIIDPSNPEIFLQSIVSEIKNNPVLTSFQLTETLKTISTFIMTEHLPDKIADHLTVFSKFNENEFNHTLEHLVLGTHIGRANNYSETELNELMSVLFFEDIGFARIDTRMKNANKVHPILSKEIVQSAGITNRLVLESIMQHEEKTDGSGYPFQLTTIHEYAQISQIVSQYTLLANQKNSSKNKLGYLYLLGQQTDFRTSQNHTSIYCQKLQEPLLSIMQERLESQQAKREYANLLYQELSQLIRWCNDKSCQDREVHTIQDKIKSALWVGDNKPHPFQIDIDALNDKAICQEFTTDAMKFLYSIVESANYLNHVLHAPIRRYGCPIAGDQFLNVANPSTH